MLLMGCGEKRVVWSPNGKWAAILGERGLYLSNGEGGLIGPLASDVVRVEWFPDSERLAMVQTRKLEAWSDVQKLMSGAEVERVEQAALLMARELDAGRDFEAAVAATGIPNGRSKEALGVYLKNVDGIRRRAGNAEALIASAGVTRSELSVAKFVGGRLSAGATLERCLGEIADVRACPTGTAVGYTVTQPDDTKDFALKVAVLDKSQSVLLIAPRSGVCPDWTPDGRALVFIRPADGASPGDNLRLATVVRCQVFDETGKLALQEKPDALAGLVYEDWNRVRCLKDGRILFAAVELHLPATTADMPQRQQLFAVDPERQATLAALVPRSAQGDLPESLTFFEPSPDGRRVALLGEKGQVQVLTLANGAVERVQAAFDSGVEATPPVWRSSDELCFVSNQREGARAQLCLWKNGVIRTLSRSWPTELRKGLLEK